MNALHAAYYADQAVQLTAEILENVRLARDTFRVRFHAPAIARRILPGQFLMLRMAGLNDPLIGRPLALYDTVITDGKPTAVDVVYLVKGKLTSKLCEMQPGQQLDVWGPLGNGFQHPSAGSKPASGEAVYLPTIDKATYRDQVLSRRGDPRLDTHLIMVAGGIGFTPFWALAQEALGFKRYGDPPRHATPVNRVTLCYGARSAEYFATADFERCCTDIRLATDDGTRGYHGLATDLLEEVLAEQWGNIRIVCCGPEPMMESVSKIAIASGVPCQVSLETPMACGIGICFTCVAKIHQPDGGWDYKRTCVDGPVFDAQQIAW